jgi:hypothetical protein
MPQPAKPYQDPNDSFLRTLFSWPDIIIVIIIAIIALIALFYAEENWRGRHAWNKYRKDLEAHGEQLELKSFIPASVPDEENFAATTLVQSWFPRGNGNQTDNYTQAERLISALEPNFNKGERHYLDLVAWEKSFISIQTNAEPSSSPKLQSGPSDFLSRARAAPAILKALEDSESDFQEVQQASKRRYSRYPIVYDMQKPWATLLPHLALLKQLCQRLELKTCAELAAGKSEKALEDVRLGLYLADTLKNEPFLISYLVRLSAIQVAIQPIWEGLAEHQWSDGQIQELQRLLSRYDYFLDTERALYSERACSILMIDIFRKDRNLSEMNSLMRTDSDSLLKPVAEGIPKIMPDGWYYQEQLNYCKLFQLQFNAIFETTNRIISPSRIKTAAEKLGTILETENLLTNHKLMAGFLLPGLGNMGSKTAKMQIAADQAVIACALERYRLANQKFPEKLEDLVPRFVSALPADVLTGNSYKYRRAGAGFVLYSPGWDEQDDGGASGKELFDASGGDWVWQYPQK